MREDPSGKDFGTRYLEDASKVFDHNAWDNIPWDESMEEEARRIVERQKQLALPEDRVHDLLAEPSLHWDNFYSQHSDRFFMNRNWLAKEFPELDMSLATEVSACLTEQVNSKFQVGWGFRGIVIAGLSLLHCVQI